MVKNVFPLFLICLFLFSNCGNDTDQQVYTGVLEGKSIQVPALTPGKITKLAVETGQEVRTGDTLAIVDATDLALQLRQLLGGKKELTVQMEIAKTTLQQANLDLDYIREKYQRMQKLVANQSMPQQNLDDLKVQVERAEVAVKTAGQTALGLEAKRDQILAQIQSVKKKINDCFILSPQPGIIANTYFESGEAVPPMSPVVEVIHINSVDVKIYIAEKTLPKIKYGQEVTIHADGLNKQFAGKVSWISPKAEFTPKTILTPDTRSSLVFAVKITISNPDGILKHGMPVEVVLARE